MMGNEKAGALKAMVKNVGVNNYNSKNEYPSYTYY